MRIRTLAGRSGLSVDTIRFYEKKGLLDASHVGRSENGYRDYNDSAIERLELIRHAQAAGFSLTEIGELFGLWQSNQLTNALIVARLREKQRQIGATISDLQRIHAFISDKIAALEAGLEPVGGEQQAQG